VARSMPYKFSDLRVMGENLTGEELAKVGKML
jgi:hypothetical protein